MVMVVTEYTPVALQMLESDHRQAKTVYYSENSPIILELVFIL